MARFREIAVNVIIGAGVAYAIFGFVITMLGLLGYCACNCGMG